MTFVEETSNQDAAIRELQEKKRKDFEEQIKKRNQAAKNHKPKNLEIPADQDNQLPIPPVGMLNSILLNIINDNFPPIKDFKNIDPKVFERQPVPLTKIIEAVIKQIDAQFKINKQELKDEERAMFMNQIFGCIRELSLYKFIELINNTEQGILVKIAPKALQYVNSINYFTLPHQLREQYGIFTTLINNGL